MLGVLINTIAIIVGSFVGLLFKRFIPEKIVDSVMIGLGLCIIYLGISGALKGENPLIAIVSMTIGAVVGTAIDIDLQLSNFAQMIENKFSGSPENSISKGFLTGSLLFCVGSMAVVGSLQAGLQGDISMLLTKSLLDLISSIMLASALGFGVVLSAFAVLAYQGSILLLSSLLVPLLSEQAINEMTCVGSLLIIALGLNIIGVAKIKISNYLPAIFIAPLLCFFIK